jgi:hypothetical protein
VRAEDPTFPERTVLAHGRRAGISIARYRYAPDHPPAVCIQACAESAPCSFRMFARRAALRLALDILEAAGYEVAVADTQTGEKLGFEC